MLRPLPPACGTLAGLLALSVALGTAAAQDRAAVRRVTWSDLEPVHGLLAARGVDGPAFPRLVDEVREANARRVREGDLDHLVFYLLQSTRFTALPPLEPALSAKALVDGLSAADRARFLLEPESAAGNVATAVTSRIAALLRALQASPDDPRLGYFRQLVTDAFPDRRAREAALAREYLRVMRFVYEKEFLAGGGADGAEAVRALYRNRGLSTDTAVEAGYLVYIGLGVLKALEPDREIRRVLIVGPGLDLAPRTALADERPVESYQPWAVIDALVALGLSRMESLEVVAADINPRVVDHLRRARERPPVLPFVSEIRETARVAFSDDYRAYFRQLGRAVGTAAGAPPSADGRLRKTVRIGADAAKALRPARLDVVTERFVGPFDLVIATNVLPYFDDVELMMAMGNVAGMLAPGGALLHNESRPFLGEVAAALGLPFHQARHAVVASVRGSAPLFDSAWLHVKSASRPVF